MASSALPDPVPTGRVATAAVLDAVAIVVFATIGRRTHDSGGSAVSATLTIAAPFLLAAAAGWLAGRAWRDPFGWAAGVTVWLVTIVAGMVLRHVVFGRGTATPFVIVASTFTMCALLGWRAVARGVLERRSTTAE